MKCNIIYLPYRRFHYVETLIKLLSKVKSRDFHVTVCGLNHHRGECADIATKLQAVGISSSPFNVTTGWTNYLDKLKGTVSLDYPYTIKLDEDIFLSSATWDYFLENLNVLDDPKMGIFSPILSNGIPTVDNFIYKHMDPASKSHIESLFSSTYIPNLWGANYQGLNTLLRARGYESDSFYAEVGKINHHYKGIHPIRVSTQAQLFLNQWIMDNFDKFFLEREYSIEGVTRPYFCNSVFAMKSSEYHKVLHDDSLFRDCFDEVALNNYIKQNNKTMLFFSGFAIHTLYNTIPCESDIANKDMIVAKEEEFYQFIKNQVNNRL
jgi:hypothetical protein